MKRMWLAVRSLVVGSIIVSSLIGCSVKRPDAIFQDAQMENILYDYHVAKAMADELPYSESCKKVLYIESVFQKHGVTRAEFDSSMVWFSRHPDVLSKIYEQVRDRLKKERDGINRLIAVRDNKPTESLPGDSVDVWIGHRVYQLTGMPLDNKLSFVLPTDTNFKDRDTLRWGVRFSLLDEDTLLAPTMALQMFYEKDTLVAGPKKILTNGLHTLSLFADTLGSLREIRGFVYSPLRKVMHHVLLDSITLMRYHATDTLRLDSLKKDAPVPMKKVEKKKEVKSDAKPVNARQGIRMHSVNLDRK